MVPKRKPCPLRITQDIDGGHLTVLQVFIHGPRTLHGQFIGEVQITVRRLIRAGRAAGHFGLRRGIRAIKRLRRKADIMKLDLKAKNYAQYHDANEILSLIDIIEREVSK